MTMKETLEEMALPERAAFSETLVRRGILSREESININRAIEGLPKLKFVRMDEIESVPTLEQLRKMSEKELIKKIDENIDAWNVLMADREYDFSDGTWRD